MINIKGLNKAEVLQTLFNNSKIQGFNVQMVSMGMMEYPKDITKNEAQAILDEMGKEKYFDYLNGKVMKVDLTSDIEFDERLYDRDNGECSAQKAIDVLKEINKNKIINELVKQEYELLKKYGYYVHSLVDDNIYNIHTHGVKDTLEYNYDFCITCNEVSPKIARNILNTVISNLKKGARFEDGKTYPNIIGNGYYVKMVKNSFDNNYLIVLLPDENGYFPGDSKCDKLYINQLSQSNIKI